MLLFFCIERPQISWPQNMAKCNQLIFWCYRIRIGILKKRLFSLWIIFVIWLWAEFLPIWITYLFMCLALEIMWKAVTPHIAQTKPCAMSRPFISTLCICECIFTSNPCVFIYCDTLFQKYLKCLVYHAVMWKWSNTF